MASFTGSQSAMLKGDNPVVVETSKSKKSEKGNNTENPFPINCDNYLIPPNWSLNQKKKTGNSVCLTYWVPNNQGGHTINEGTIVLKYLYFDTKTHRTFVFTKSGNKYYLANANAYFNPNYKVAVDPYQLTSQLENLV